MKKFLIKITAAALIAAAVALIASCEALDAFLSDSSGIAAVSEAPEFSGTPYAYINGNIPEFDESELERKPFEEYSDLDSLGRCRTAYAMVGRETMPTEDRGDISGIHPTGWESTRYDFIDGKNLYNRCHLIAFMLSGENANAENLITGTRYMNTEGMLPFETEVADYIYRTGKHVLYRVTPVFEGNNLVASGVHMEAMSAEDHGEGVRFNVYCYNVQPGVKINYANGENHLDGAAAEDDDDTEREYVLNTSSRRFHLPECDSVKDMNPKNRSYYTGTESSLINAGYSPCGSCIAK